MSLYENEMEHILRISALSYTSLLGWSDGSAYGRPC